MQYSHPRIDAILRRLVEHTYPKDVEADVMYLYRIVDKAIRVTNDPGLLETSDFADRKRVGGMPV